MVRLLDGRNDRWPTNSGGGDPVGSHANLHPRWLADSDGTGAAMVDGEAGGADGAFTLYEDENDNYNYEKGTYATIPFRWDEANQTLTIGERQGQFQGMLAERTIHVVFVGEKHGVGIDEAEAPYKIVQYVGKQVTVTP
jgi:alpha-D-xyloside xylohydrolase